ncbi:hypothetical protein CEJ87_06685 [Caldifermentibacillus hisashii]|nr:hypothetical protein CEJ87_06685 [Caldifermentibacillus hisashii]
MLLIIIFRRLKSKGSKKMRGGNVMKRENSFAELTKASLENTQQKDKFIQSVYIDLLIQEALLKEKRRVIKEKIDEAIDQCDRESFFLLAKQLTEIEEQLNA